MRRARKGIKREAIDAGRTKRENKQKRRKIDRKKNMRKRG